MLTSPSFLPTCKRCHAFCCTIVTPLLTPQERDIILQAGYPNRFIKITNDVYRIRPNNRGECPYIQSNYTCEIHHVKPKLCSIWPVIPRNNNNKRSTIVIKCPLFTFLSEDELQQAKKEACAISPSVIFHLWNISSVNKDKAKRFKYEEL